MATIAFGGTAQIIPTSRSTMELAIPRFESKSEMVGPARTRIQILNPTKNNLNQRGTERGIITSHATILIVSILQVTTPFLQ